VPRGTAADKQPAFYQHKALNALMPGVGWM
jgi:hypothetical protein